MRKFYSFFIALLTVCGLAQAQTTFTAGTDAAASDDDRTFTKGDITLTITDGRLNTPEYRVYKSQTLTITSAGKKITAVKFTCTANGTAKYGPGSFNAQEGYTFEEAGKVGMWQGSATSVSFTAESNQVRAKEIIVAVEGETIDGGIEPGPGPDPQPGDIDWTSSATAPLTVAAVLEKAAKLEQGANSDKEVYVKGKISQIKYTFSADYGTATFSISDDGQTENEFLCYGTYYLGNRAWVEGDDQIAVGDEVIVFGTVTNYKGTLEMASKKNYLYSLNGKTDGGTTPDPQPGDIDWTSSATAPLTVAAVLEKAGKLEQGKSSDKDVYVKGKISSIKFTFDAEHGTATFSISDNGQAENEFLCYGTYYLGNRAWVEGDDQINVGDEVIVFGTVTNYKGTLEMASKKNCLYSLNGKTDGGQTPDPQPGDIDWTSSATAPLTVAAVLEKAGKLEQGKSSDKDVYVKGKISSIKFTFDAEHGTATFSISDSGQAENEFLCYGTYYLGNRAWVEGDDQINVGDEVIVFGTVTNYKGTLEMASKKNCLYSLNGKTDGGQTPDPQPSEIDWTSSATVPLTVAAVLEKAGKLEQGKNSDKDVYVKGKISSIKFTFDAEHGTATFSISDNGQAENEFLCYGTYYLGNRAWVEGDDQINVGDEVIVFGTVTNYKGTLEMASKKNCLYSLNGKTDGGQTPDPVVTEYTKIADVKTAATKDRVDVVFKAADLLVTCVNGKSTYVFDGTDGLLLYGTVEGVKAGDKFAASIKGQLYLYNGLTEIAVTEVTDLAVASSDNAVTAQEVTIADVTNNYKQYENELVIIKELVAETEGWTNRNVNFMDDSDNVIVVRDNFKNVADVTFDTTKTYDITGFVSIYNNTVQLFPRDAADLTVESPETFIPSLNVAAANQTVYNLNGQRVKNAAKAGIYVVGGRKVVVK